MPAIRCGRCSFLYPDDGVPFLCPVCGGVFDFDGLPVFDPQEVDESYPGMWRYLHTFGLPRSAPLVSLGEGNTPLIPVLFAGQPVWLKMESLNPTGSYKDRGSAVLLSRLVVRGARQAVEDSSGNAGASFAAYAARAGIQARVYVPESASGPKRNQIEAYGAELVAVAGPRSAAAAAVLEEARAGVAYASHAYLPFGLAGVATIAYEIWERTGAAPGTIIAPVGHGGLLLGIMRGFATLQASGLTGAQPYYLGVQAKACAPVWLGWQNGLESMNSVEEGQTAAEGVRVQRPVRAEAILQVLSNPSMGAIYAVEESEILPAYRELAHQGVHVEPTSALAWAALKHFWGKIPGPIVLILSGAGLKYSPKIS